MIKKKTKRMVGWTRKDWYKNIFVSGYRYFYWKESKTDDDLNIKVKVTREGKKITIEEVNK